MVTKWNILYERLFSKNKCLNSQVGLGLVMTLEGPNLMGLYFKACNPKPRPKKQTRRSQFSHASPVLSARAYPSCQFPSLMELSATATARLLSCPPPSLPLKSKTRVSYYRAPTLFTFGRSNFSGYLSKVTFMDSHINPRASPNDENGSTLTTSLVDSGI